MLVTLIAAGAIALEHPAGTGPILAVADQTALMKPGVPIAVASAPIPPDAPRLARAFDPADRAPAAMDWTPYLAAGERITEILALTMTAAGAALGVQIDDDAGREPIIGESGKAIQLWFKVLDEEKGNAAFSGAGVSVGIAALVRTDSVPPREYERTVVLNVRQQ